MSTGPSALMAALVDEAGEEPGGRFFVNAQQLDMLRDDKGRLQPNALRVARSGPGRRPGSANKANKQIAKWFIGKYGDPLDVLGEIMVMPLDVLYEQMVLAQGGEQKTKRLTGKDAFDLKMRAVNEALPYIHGKQPLNVNVTGKADAVLFIPGINAPEGFGREDLEAAVQRLGPDAISVEGIHLPDGRVVQEADFEPVEDDDG